MTPPPKTISWPYAVLILASLAVAVAWFASVQLKAFHATRDHTGPAAIVRTMVPHSPAASPGAPTHRSPSRAA